MFRLTSPSKYNEKRKKKRKTETSFETLGQPELERRCGLFAEYS